MGTLTITTTAAQDARLVVAYGAKLNLGRSATGAEIKADIIDSIVSVVRLYEEPQSVRAAIAATVLPTPIAPA
jgi:hypothetical protein